MAARDNGSRVLQWAPGVDLSRLELEPAEAFLLSRVDGRTPWDVLREVGGIPPERADRCLERWLEEGVLVLVAPATASSSQAAGRASAAREGTASPPGPVRSGAVAEGLDPALEIPLDAQRRILEFEARLDRPYHEILGVAPDADRRALKRAYFALSREFHPDRYFRRRIGPFAERLDRIFKKLVEAYELLSDPVARAEAERSQALRGQSAQPQQQGATGEARAGEAALSPGQVAARRLLRLHERTLQARRLKAKRFFEAAMAARRAGRPLEAVAGVRLALAFDPGNASYREALAEHAGEAQALQADEKARRAEAALESGDTRRAIALLEAAIELRPHDPALNRRLAELLAQSGGDLRRAKTLAEHACELVPEDADCHVALALVLRAAGLEANARRELREALRLDPDHPRACAALGKSKRGLMGLISGGRR